jgi:hypothetical protein
VLFIIIKCHKKSLTYAVVRTDFVMRQDFKHNLATLLSYAELTESERIGISKLLQAFQLDHPENPPQTLSEALSLYNDSTMFLSLNLDSK